VIKLEKKTARFVSGLHAGEVAYLIVGGVVYFTQTEGNISSVNAAEDIIETISTKENLDFRDFGWVDIQRTPRYSANCQDILTIHRAELHVTAWETISVPTSVMRAFGF